MDIKKEKMHAPVKFTVVLDAEDLEQRKVETYEKLKDSIELPGFRKGLVPRDVAENKLGVERIYKPMIDQIFRDIVVIEPNIVSSYDFKFFGDFKKKMPLTIEFVADMKPTVKLCSLEDFKKTEKLEDNVVTDKDLAERINNEIKQSEKIVDCSKDVLDNFDIAVIDFEGHLEGEDKPFKGGTAKNYQLKINEIVNGRKKFIDNFEDQLVGMKVGETKEVKVTFPLNYHDKALSNKRAFFIVKLNSIKSKIVPDYDEQFAKSKGFDSIQCYEEHLKNKIADERKNRFIENFKKNVVTKIINGSDISPIPQSMIDVENEKEWNSLLRRIGKTPEQLEKDNNITKEIFFSNNNHKSIEIIKASLVLEQIAKEYNIVASEDEVVQYASKLASYLKYTDEKEFNVKRELKANKKQFDLMYTATVNEKTIDFLFNELK